MSFSVRRGITASLVSTTLFASCMNVIHLNRRDVLALKARTARAIHQNTAKGEVDAKIADAVVNQVEFARGFGIDGQAAKEMNAHLHHQQSRAEDRDVIAVLFAMRQGRDARTEEDFFTQFFSPSVTAEMIYAALAERVAARDFRLLKAHLSDERATPEICGLADLKLGEEVYAVRFHIELSDHDGRKPILTFIAPRLSLAHTNHGLGVYIYQRGSILLVRGWTSGEPQSAYDFDMNRLRRFTPRP